MILVTLKKNLSVSITGEECYLNCKHCGRRYLKSMKNFKDIPENPGSYTSLLISGGINEKGEVPIEILKDEIKRLKEKGYKLNLHVGIVGEKRNLNFLKYADTVSVEIISSNEIIKNVFRADFNIDDYIRTYHILKDKVNVHPHITLGLDCGEMKYDYNFVGILEDLKPKKLVVNIFIPTLNTEFENCNPPDLRKVEDILKILRKNLNTKLFLGCMQPKGRYREDLQIIAFRNKMDVIVKPVKKLIDRLKDSKLNYEYFDECCSFVEV